MFRSIQNHPVESSYETGLEVFDDTHSIESLRQPFVETRYYDLLASNPPRFSDYVWEDRQKFVDFFGADVSPVEHGPYQARTIAIPLIESLEDTDIFSADIEAHRGFSHLFIAYHVTHDDHEGICGDTRYVDKNEDSETSEYNIWDSMVSEVYGVEKSRKLRRFAKDCMGASSNQVQSEIWNISERLGYFATGLQAWVLATEEADLTLAERNQSLLMAGDVTLRHVAELHVVRDKFPYCDDILTQTSSTVSSICNSRGYRLKDIVEEVKQS